MIVNVSEKTETKLKEIALQRGEDVADLAGILLEEKTLEAGRTTPRKKKLSEFAGIFYGGDGKTAENASEILRTEIDKNSGFGK